MGKATVAFSAYAVLGVVLCFFYPDSYQQDGALHFLCARWAWHDADLFVAVWPRPGFTTLYALPALLGYPAAKIFTVLITAATGWQTAKTAQALKLDRAWMAAPILVAFPVVLLLSIDTMTEPLFALILIWAVREHLEGKTTVALLIASFLPTVRPEGFVLCLMWGFFALAEKFPMGLRLLRPLCLSGGTLVWVLAAWAISGDPLYIAHTWPWSTGDRGSVGGVLSLLRYPMILPLIVGPCFVPFLVVGLVRAFRERWFLPLSLFGLHAILHVAFTWLNLFDAGGRTRYIVPVAPLLALFVLRGWNAVAAWRPIPRIVSIALFAVSFGFGFGAIDLSPTNRDWAAFADAIEGARRQGHVAKTTLVLSSQTYAYVDLDRRPPAVPLVRADRTSNFRVLQTLPRGTLVFWDRHFGPWYFALEPDDFVAAGFRTVSTREYDLKPKLPWPAFLQDWTGRRRQRIDILFRD